MGPACSHSDTRPPISSSAFSSPAVQHGSLDSSIATRRATSDNAVCRCQDGGTDRILLQAEQRACARGVRAVRGQKLRNKVSGAAADDGRNAPAS
jgi:hypothetical protein